MEMLDSSWSREESTLWPAGVQSPVGPISWAWLFGLMVVAALLRIVALNQQQHQILPAIDLNLSPKWEVNFGLGVGLTRSTDHLIAKMILGYRFDF